MGLFWKKEDKDFRIEIWKMEDASLSKRERERVTTRKMLDHVMGKETVIVYDEHGKPHVEGCHISITHTGDFVGVIVSEQRAVGIDLERVIEGRIEHVANRFLSPLEKQQGSLQYYYMVWGAKEVLYKIYGKKGLIFSEHLFTEPFEELDKGEFAAWIKTDAYERQFAMQYEFIDNLLLTFAVKGNPI